MPKGQKRTEDDRIKDLLDAKKKLDDELAELNRDKINRLKREAEAENFQLGVVVRAVIERDKDIKRKLIDMTAKLDLKEHARKALQRVLGPLPAPESEVLPEIAPTRPDLTAKAG